MEALKESTENGTAIEFDTSGMELDIQPRQYQDEESSGTKDDDLETARQSLEEMKIKLKAAVEGPKRDLDDMAELAKEAEKRHVEKVSMKMSVHYATHLN